MGRLIDASVLFEQVEESKKNNSHHEVLLTKRIHDQEHTHFLYMICQQPTVTRPSDIESDWEDFSVTENVEVAAVQSAKCRNCGYYSEQVNAFPHRMTYKFCPFCGATMKECNDGSN